MRPRIRTFVAALCLSGVVFGGADPADAGPRQGGPTQGKHVAQKPPSKPQPKGGGTKKPAAKAPSKPAKKSNESKKAPKYKNSPPKPADDQARTSIAGKPVTETAADSAELKELKEVEGILFWDIPGSPAATPATSKPQVVSTGLPPMDEAAQSPGSSSDAPTADLRWMAQLAKPDLPFRWDVRLIRYLDYFKNNPRGRNFVTALLKRAGRFEVKIREALRAKNLPEDLVYLALAESGMNPRIVSPAGAAGLWQFMPKAGEAYGLRIDKHVDERLDPQRSTEAAVRFLKDLHSRFGRWELAMAAYNMGHGGLLSAIRKYNTNDFWELSQLEAGVPYETALYVPKIVAMAFVARNKEIFGCQDLQPDAAEPFDVASAPAPAQKTEAAPKKTAAAKPPPPAPAVDSDLAGIETEPYTVRWGESLELVAASVGMTESKLRALNAFKDPVPPRPGSKILVPKNRSKPIALDRPVAVIPARTSEPAGSTRVFYEVVWGDKMEDVARILGVTADDLCQWNNLDRTANLHGKMVLQAFVPAGHSLVNVRVLKPTEASVLVVGTTEFFDYFEAKNGRQRAVITVADGDTMKTLAKKHGLSIGMMERINHRSRDADLKSGETLVVYARRSTPAPTTPVVATPAPDLSEPAVDAPDEPRDTSGG